MVGKWQQYVASHSDYSRQLEETSVWLRDVESKLAYCSDLSASSQKELEAKLATVKVRRRAGGVVSWVIILVQENQMD